MSKNDEWVHVKEASERLNKSTYNLNVTAHYDRKRGYAERIKKDKKGRNIFNVASFQSACEMNENETLKIEALYFKVLDYFEDNEESFIDYLSKEMRVSRPSMVDYFERFQFKRKTPALAYKKAFEKIISMNQPKLGASS